MVDATAVWLAPGLAHPVYARFAQFFGTLFRGFEALDYRELYLSGGAALVEDRARALVRACGAQIVLYSQFPSSYAYLHPDFLASLGGKPVVVGFGYDDEIYFEQAKFFYLRCDAVITTDIPDADRLRAAGIAVHLAQLQQPHVVPAAASATADIPVSFVGDMTKPGRQTFIATLEDAGIRVADYGAGSRNGRLSDAGVLDVFQRSAINLNFTRTNPPAWVLRRDPARAGVGQIKGRPFELATLGKFCLCEWAPYVDHWFRPDVEIGVFRDPAGLVAAVKKYLDDPALRERIAAAAHRRYRAEYEPHLHFERIFSDILAHGRKPKPTVTASPDAIFYESTGRSKAVAFLHALRRIRPLRALAEVFAREWPHASFWRGFVGGLKDTLTAQFVRR